MFVSTSESDGFGFVRKSVEMVVELLNGHLTLARGIRQLGQVGVGKWKAHSIEHLRISSEWDVEGSFLVDENFISEYFLEGSNTSNVTHQQSRIAVS